MAAMQQPVVVVATVGQAETVEMVQNSVLLIARRASA
jgi:hypothetical protein